ncbi:MAG: hypothetical protein OXL96_11855 [Candidatus Poribacteria bacterium]|nr:hypothetical protein [Candidatus Poribacteria bacterium]
MAFLAQSLHILHRKCINPPLQVIDNLALVVDLPGDLSATLAAEFSTDHGSLPNPLP